MADEIFYRPLLKVGDKHHTGRIYSESSLLESEEKFASGDEAIFCFDHSHKEFSMFDVFDWCSIHYVVKDLMYLNDVLVAALLPAHSKARRIIRTEEELRKNNIPSALVFNPVVRNVKYHEQTILDFDIVGFSINLSPTVMKTISQFSHK